MDRTKYISEDAYAFFTGPVDGPPSEEAQRAYNAKAEIYLGRLADGAWRALQTLIATRALFLRDDDDVQTHEVPLTCPDGRCFDLYSRLNDQPGALIPESISHAYADPAYCGFLITSCLAGKQVPPDVEFIVDEQVDSARPMSARFTAGKRAHRYLAILRDRMAIQLAYPS